jgi:hypothetical protein
MELEYCSVTAGKSASSPSLRIGQQAMQSIEMPGTKYLTSFYFLRRGRCFSNISARQILRRKTVKGNKHIKTLTHLKSYLSRRQLTGTNGFIRAFAVAGTSSLPDGFEVGGFP